MEIIHSKSTWPPSKGGYKNCIVIYDDDWNDFLYKTTFHMVYCDSDGEVIRIGDVKIYYYDYDEKRTEKYGRAVHSVIGSTVVQLSEKFCSLGQSLSYYQKLKKYLPLYYKKVLKKLNDIAIFPEIKEKFINERGVQVSLLRDSSAEKALNC